METVAPTAKTFETPALRHHDVLIDVVCGLDRAAGHRRISDRLVADAYQTGAQR